ncbi:MAG: biotin/lipoyl-binding protein [Ktedonobacteraceae bacterium]|nr:biotin/lipoyl-binding protein [Ktedonobacteraceae bacterium]
MDSDRHYPYKRDAFPGDDAPNHTITIEQLQYLVQLLDRSDIAEIEVRLPAQETRLALRKAQAPEGQIRNGSHPAAQVAHPATLSLKKTEEPAPVETRHTVIAPLVGIFHSWIRPRGGPLVSVGDHITVGQTVGTIQSLNIMNEVESTVAGRVVEILVQDGQPVEYGQPLMVIESTEEQ